MTRLFNTAQRKALHTAAAGYCEACGVELDEHFHADHVTAHTHGGTTTLENGQALCGPCNIAKSAHTVDRKIAPALKPVPTATSITPRKWQADLLEKVIAAGSGITAISLNACVGAGKTDGLTYLYQQHLAPRFRRPLLVVAVPVLNLLSGWTRAFNRANLTFSEGIDMLTTREVEAGMIHGIGLTYQSIDRSPDVLNALCNRFDVIVIRDECQWISDSNQWGSNFADATRNAAFHIGATGTPFRTAETELVWGWDGDPATVLSFDYDYTQALADRVVPELVWTAVGGSIEWAIERNGVREARASRFGEDEDVNRHGNLVDEGLVNERLRYAVHADATIVSGFLIELVRMADKRLAKIRKHQRNAGGIIFAQSIAAATTIAGVLRNWGRTVQVVTSETPAARDRIADFTVSAAEWIVSVDMLREGTDIPRLRVGVIANNTTAKRFIDQEVGRLLRLFELLGWEDQRVEMFIPRDPRMVTALEKFGVDIGRKRAKQGGGGGGGGGGGRYTLVSIGAEDIATDLVGTIGEPGGSPRNFDDMRAPFEASGMGIGFDAITAPQRNAIVEIASSVAEIGRPVIGAFALAEYIGERDALAATLALRTGFDRKACRVLVDRLMRPYSNPHRIGALPMGGNP